MFDKLKEFVIRFRDLSYLSLATMFVNSMGGLFWLYMASLLGTEEYGKISYFISIAIMASTISLVGMSNTVIVFGAKNVKIQSTVFVTGLISSILTALILSYVFINNTEISLYVIGYVTFTLVTQSLIGLKLFSKYSKIIILQKILMVILAISFYHLIGSGGVILGIAISFLPFTYIIFKTFREMKIDFTIFRSRYRFIVNSYLLDISSAFNGSLDKIIIAPILGFVLLGNYQLGLQFIAILVIIPGIFYQYTLPRDASNLATKNLKIVMISISIIITILSILLSPVIIPALFPKFIHTVEIIQIMSFSIISSTIISAYISKYLGLAKSKIVIIGSGIYFLIQIPSLLILGEMYGVNGAAVSIVMASVIHAIYFVIVDYFTKTNLRTESN